MKAYLTVISKSNIKVDIYDEIDLVMLKILAFHYWLTMVVVVNFSDKMGATRCRVVKKRQRLNPAFLENY